MGENLFEVKNITKVFRAKKAAGKKGGQFVHAVNDVSFQIKEKETFALVGESGCGKSTTGRVALRLIEPSSGDILYQGKSLLSLNSRELRKMRREMQMVFQDPYSSLNPRKSILSIVAEPLLIHKMAKSKAEAEEEARKLLLRVGIREDQMNRYPHEFSGGQKQRISMARAIITRPKLVICDEPVSALDVSIQAQVLNLLRELQNEYQLSYLFISHDMSVVKYISDRIAVMYLGTIVEEADAEELFANPIHPYTRALLSAVPEADPDVKKERIVLHGEIPSPVNFPSGCPFHTRCEYATERCNEERPKRTKISNNHYAVCHYCDRLQKEGEGV
ncbi:MAG: dipeptide ABC transporter ATP-binding protein [Lachnospiraceae bacterium]